METGQEAVRSAGEIGREVLQGIVDRMGLEATVSLVEDSTDEVLLDIVGGDLAILIGRGGDTLAALQLLLGVIVNRADASHRRVIVDAAGYRGRREDALRRRAEEVARNVKATGKEALIDSLQAYERRIIHTALAEDPDVYTYSEGEGEDRVLVISPRD